jgi:hypothetical protein
VTTPDTTEVVARALIGSDSRWSAFVTKDRMAVAIAADRNALDEQGYAIVKVGEVLPWMEAEHICPCGSTVRFGDPFIGHACFGCDCYPEPTGLYRPVAAQQ